MKFLWAFAIISVIGQLIIIIAACCGKKSHYRDNITIVQQEDSQSPEQFGITPDRDNPTIADQFDSRITNVFQNPMKGIL